MEKKDKNKTSMGVAALTLGIISILTSFFWYLVLPTGILAIIFGVKSAKKIGSRLGKAGLITGIVGLSLFAFMYIEIAFLLILYNIK